MSRGPSSIQKSIQVEASTRPIKVAYIVPVEESELNHWILDSVFNESYSRWGGFFTLIIPFKGEDFERPEFWDWLRFCDPDFVFSYIDLPVKVIQKIEDSCSPIAMVKKRKVKGEVTRWRDMMPEWGTFFTSVPSLSTILSPHALYGFRHEAVNEKRVVVTQYSDIPSERFISDNFGVSHNVSAYTNPVSGLFETVCLAKDKDPKDRVTAGTVELGSALDVFSKIESGTVTTFSKLSRIHSRGIPRINSHLLNKSFVLYVGQSLIDRINFWNTRLLAPSWAREQTSIIIRAEHVEDEGFLKVLGTYLNRFNSFSGNNGNPNITLKSHSLNFETLEKLHQNLKKKTYHNIELSQDSFNQPLLPKEDDFKSIELRSSQSNTFKVFEKKNSLIAEKPYHFKYIPAEFDSISNGTWAVDLLIERHNSYSKYVNVVDVWQLPRRNQVCHAFTQNISKVNGNYHLTVIPRNESGYSFHTAESQASNWEFDIKLPSDEVLFRYITISSKQPRPYDMRSVLDGIGFEDISISDKGQNLRGVVSMFDSFSDAANLLTKKLWREILRSFGKKESIEFNELFGRLPNGSEFKMGAQRHFHFVNGGKTIKFLKANFVDSLEYLVQKKVFFQVHRWRCSYCGHINILSIDELKKENECGVCRLKYFSPLDLEWQYKINSFVSNTLCDQHGLPVLWAIGWLYENCHTESFYYLPEVNLFQKEGRAEIDILCVKGGLFHAIEVKKTAAQLTFKNEEVEKYIKKIKTLRPDVALLMFENWSENGNDNEIKEAFKEIIAKVKREADLPNLKVNCIVANDFKEFSNYSYELGYEGARSHSILYEDED